MMIGNTGKINGCISTQDQIWPTGRIFLIGFTRPISIRPVRTPLLGAIAHPIFFYLTYF